MYTIGQVAKFLGVSRDTLKFYEEKGLVKPSKIVKMGIEHTIILIYTISQQSIFIEIDFEIKKIQELRKGKSIEGIQSLLVEKEQVMLEEIAYKSYN